MLILLGGSGFVGTAYRRYFQAQGIAYVSPNRAELDYGNPAQLARFLKDTRAEFVVNAAGYTGKPNVDACELHKAECLLGNAVLPGQIAEGCAAAGVPWGHVSTGCIYSKAKPDGSGYTEGDPPNFSFRQNYCSFYSGSKALGEEVLAGVPATYIWRLRMPFNEIDSPRNYLTKLLRYDRLLDVRNSLSQLDEFVAATITGWQQRIPFGIYNLTNPGAITTREVVELIRQSGVSRKDFQFFANEAEFMRTAAKTPRSNCILDTTKLEQTGIKLTGIHEAITLALRQWKPASA